MGKTMQLPEETSVQTLARFLSPLGIFRLGLGLGIALLLLQFFFLRIDLGWQEFLADETLSWLSSSLAAAALVYGAYQTDKNYPKLKHAWYLLAAAGVSLAIGDTLVLVFTIGLGRPPFPSLADVFFLLVYLFLLAGILRIPVYRRTNVEIIEYVLDITVILLSAGLVFWNYLVGPIFLSGSADGLVLLVSAAYPVANVILLWAAVILVSTKFSVQSRQPVWLLSAAMVSLIVLDTMQTYYRLTGIGSDYEILYLLKIISPLLLMLSGLSHAYMSTVGDLGDEAKRIAILPNGMDLVRLALPYLWVGAAYLVLCYGPTSQQVASVFTMSVWVAVILGVVILRQIFVGRENQRLAAQLNHLNTDLEQLFVERTAALIRTNEELRREVFERDRMERLLRERDDKLVYFSFHDALTGLPNRALLIERLGQAIRRVKRQEDFHFAVLYFDFDGFKYINDSLGHQAGDQLLIAIARRLEASIRDLDTVARLGGDEFVIVADGISLDEDALVAVQRIQEILAAPFELQGHKVFMSASIGVVIGDGTYDQATDILRDADLAMYQAKAAGKSRYVIFSPEMRISALNRLILESDMRAALEKNEFAVHYQPIFSFDSEKLVGFEALLRWQHPQHGSIPPMDFIPIAESSGLIVPITEWVLQQACGQLQAWMTEFESSQDLTVSVNLSAKLFSEPNLASMIQTVLQESGLPAKNLKLEITETSIVEDADSATLMLQACRAMGVQVYIDDFGTGYSALSYLHQFPIDTLKIDRAFIGRIQEDGANTEVVRTIIALARELKLEVIAEGVETAVQYDFLKKLGCQGGQGFYMARPLDAVAARLMIANKTGLAPA
jgi:diguanylate cyclase (GGDEF)-like protein